ncbi:GTP cyclohydrolase II RibA [Nocardia anaemiae]|uniref:GTP cyclohydrolase II RibA n=1 Tax=Nocardia anaemiae TaxID=263910 RepID=UPI0012F51CA2|nr:GTP cyclohydrolase II RibA [Nocardia anaemiae]
MSSPLSDEELAHLLSDPLAGFERPNPRSVRQATAAFIVYPWYGSATAMRDELAQLCARYNEAIAEPGYDPYQVAADLQQGQISVHPFSTDFNGRASRVALYWSLECAGQPPSALPSFNKDIFSSPAEWAEQVRQGSARYRKWKARVESDPTLDPVALFELEPVRQRYRALGGTGRPFPPGNYFTGRVVMEFHRVLRSSAPLDEFAALELLFVPTGPPVITELTRPGTADQAPGDRIGRRPHEGEGRDSSDFLERGRIRIPAAWAGMGPLRSTHFPPPGRRMTTNDPDINAALWGFSLWMAHVANQGLNGLSGQWDSADVPEAKRELLTQLYFWISNQRYLRQVWAVARDPNIVGIDGKKDPEYFRTRFTRGVNDVEMYGDLMWLRAGIDRDSGTGQWHGGVGTQAFWTASAIGRILRARMRDEAEDPAVLVNTVELPNGTRVDGNLVRRFDRDKFAIETASAADQQRIFDAAMTELATLVAVRSPNPSSDTLRHFANVVYLLFQAPLIIGGSDATIRMFAATTMTFAFGRPVRLPHDLDSQAKARNQSDFIVWFTDILTRRLGATGPASESARPHLIGPPSAELFARGVQALRQQRTSIELQPGSDIEQWVAGRGLGILSGPHAVEDAFARASRDLLQEEGLSEVRRPEGPVRRSVVKRAIAARLRIIAGFTDPDFSRAYPDNLYGDNRDIRRDNATALQRIAHKLETDAKYSLTDVLEEAREHAFDMQAKYEGFRGQQVIRPGTQPWSLSTITQNLMRQLPEGVGPDTARDVIDAVIRIAELVSSTSAAGDSEPGTDADAAIVLTVNEGADRQLRLRAQLDYNAHGTPPSPAMLNLALAGANCQFRVEESRPLSVTEPHPRHRVLLDFSSPITDTGRDWTEITDRPAGPVMVPITVGHAAGAVARRARFLIRGELGGPAYIARFAPVVGELINRCRASDVEVHTDRRGEATALGIRAGNWVLDLQTAGPTTPTVLRISFPTVVRDDLRAVLIALLPEAPRFAESLAEEASGFAPGELTIAVTGEPGGRTVEFTSADHPARRVVRTEPANNPVGSAVLDSSARSAGPAVHDIAEPPVTADTRIPILGVPGSTQHTAPPINVHICTKDGPQRLNEIISDIAAVIPAVNAVFVYDDSVDWINRAHNRLALKSAPFRTVYIDESRRRELLRNLPWPDEAAEAYARYAFKELGRAEWNHAGIRGLAHFVAAATAAPGSRVLFLDDDMRLSEGTFRGKVHQVDSEAIADLLSRPISDDRVVGAEYVGRADVYDAEHAKHALASDSTARHQTNYRFVPTYDGTEREDALEGAVPITGAFLLMDDQGVRRVPIPHTYNEDIAFIAVLQAHGYRIEVAPFKPLHTGDEKRIKWRTAFIQQVGVVIQKSLEQALEEVGVDDLQALVDRAIGYCDRNAEMAAEIWKELFRDTDRQFGEVHSRNVYALVDTERIAREAGTALAAYLRSWSGWRKLVDDPAVSAYVRRAAHLTFGTEPAAAHRVFEVVERQADRSPGTDQADMDRVIAEHLGRGNTTEPDGPAGTIGSRPPNGETPLLAWHGVDPVLIAAELTAKWPRLERIVGFDHPGADPEALRDIARAIDDLYTRYPHINIREVRVVDPSELPNKQAGAHTDPTNYRDGEPGSIIKVNLRRVLDAHQYHEMRKEFVSAGLHRDGSQIRPFYRLIQHEGGHALDNVRPYTHLIMADLLDTYLNHSGRELSFVTWLDTGPEKLSGYSYISTTPGRRHVRPAEAGPEAFWAGEAEPLHPHTPLGTIYRLATGQKPIKYPPPEFEMHPMRSRWPTPAPGVSVKEMFVDVGSNRFRVVAERPTPGAAWRIAPATGVFPEHDVLAKALPHLQAESPAELRAEIAKALGAPSDRGRTDRLGGTQQSSLIDGAGTGRRSDADMARETPEVEKIEALRGRPGVEIELMTFEDGVQVLRETYRYAEHAMREWAQALICRAMGAPIAEVRLSPPEFHVLYRDYQYEGASRDPRAADLLGISAAITGKKSPFAAAFVRYVDGRKVWQDHHLPRQAIVDIGQVVMYAGDLLEQMAFPESLSRTVLNTQRAAMDSLREIAQHAESPLRMARLDDDAQAKTRLIEDFLLRHPYLELAGFDSPHVPKETVGEILAKLDDLLDRYRYAPGFRMLMTNIRKLRIDFLFGARATTAPEPNKHGKYVDRSTVRAELTFSMQFAADRDWAVAASDRDLRYGVHPSSGQPYADDVCHEFAHAIDQATGGELSRNLTVVLRDAHAKLQERGLIEGYERWRNRLAKTTRDSEALAVGFADAQINGNVVGTPRWVIHEYVANLQPPHVESAHFTAHPDLPEGLIGSRPSGDPSSDVRSRTARGLHSQQPDRVEPASAATDPDAPASETSLQPPRSDYPGTDSARLANPLAHESARILKSDMEQLPPYASPEQNQRRTPWSGRTETDPQSVPSSVTETAEGNPKPKGRIGSRPRSGSVSTPTPWSTGSAAVADRRGRAQPSGLAGSRSGTRSDLGLTAGHGSGTFLSGQFPAPDVVMSSTDPARIAALRMYSLWQAHTADRGFGKLRGRWLAAATSAARRRALFELYAWVSQQRYERAVWARERADDQGARDMHPALARHNARRDPNVIKPDKFRRRLVVGDPNVDMFGVRGRELDGARFDPESGQWEGGSETPAFRAFFTTGERIRARFAAESPHNETLQNVLELPDGTRVNSNTLLMGAAADAVGTAKQQGSPGRVDPFDHGAEKFVTVTADPADQRRIFDAAIAEIGVLLERSSKPSPDTVRNFANTVYLLFHAPLINRGSDTTIRIFAAIVHEFLFGRPLFLPHDVDLQAYSRSQSDFVEWLTEVLDKGRRRDAVVCFRRGLDRVHEVTGAHVGTWGPAQITERGVLPLPAHRAAGGTFHEVATWGLLEQQLSNDPPGTTALVVHWQRGIVDGPPVDFRDSRSAHTVVLTRGKTAGVLEFYESRDDSIHEYSYGARPADVMVPPDTNSLVVVKYGPAGNVLPANGPVVLPPLPIADTDDSPPLDTVSPPRADRPGVAQDFIGSRPRISGRDRATMIGSRPHDGDSRDSSGFLEGGWIEARGETMPWSREMVDGLSLTPPETEILAHARNGMTHIEIAMLRNLSERAVLATLASVRRKLRIQRTRLVTAARPADPSTTSESDRFRAAMYAALIGADQPGPQQLIAEAGPEQLERIMRGLGADHRAALRPVRAGARIQVIRHMALLAARRSASMLVAEHNRSQAVLATALAEASPTELRTALDELAAAERQFLINRFGSAPSPANFDIDDSVRGSYAVDIVRDVATRIATRAGMLIDGENTSDRSRFQTEHHPAENELLAAVQRTNSAVAQTYTADQYLDALVDWLDRHDPAQPDPTPAYHWRSLPMDHGFDDEQRRLAAEALRAGGFGTADRLQRWAYRLTAGSARRRAIENSQWWDSLSDPAEPGGLSSAQRALIQVYPHQIGNADGLPAVIRDHANRLSIRRELDEFTARKPVGVGMLNWIRTDLTAAERKQLSNLIHIRNHLQQLDRQATEMPGSPPVHLLSYDSTAFHGKGKAVVSLGNVDTAHTVNWHVPGTDTTSASLAYQAKPLRNLYEETLRVEPSLELASIIWIGYDAPAGSLYTGYVKAAFRRRAQVGGDRLLCDIAALHATRRRAGTAAPTRLVNRLYGHSYGSVTTCYAGRGGRLAGLVGSITLSGSPGAGPVRHAAEFGIGADNVYIFASWRDPVTMFGADRPGAQSRVNPRLGHGMDPATEAFGAQRLGAEFPDSPDFAGAEAVHQGYLHYDPTTGRPNEALANTAQITAGHGDALPRIARRRAGSGVIPLPADVERGRYAGATSDSMPSPLPDGQIGRRPHEPSASNSGNTESDIRRAVARRVGDRAARLRQELVELLGPHNIDADELLRTGSSTWESWFIEYRQVRRELVEMLEIEHGELVDDDWIRHVLAQRQEQGYPTPERTAAGRVFAEYAAVAKLIDEVHRLHAWAGAVEAVEDELARRADEAFRLIARAQGLALAAAGFRPLDAPVRLIESLLATVARHIEAVRRLQGQADALHTLGMVVEDYERLLRTLGPSYRQIFSAARQYGLPTWDSRPGVRLLVARLRRLLAAARRSGDAGGTEELRRLMQRATMVAELYDAIYRLNADMDAAIEHATAALSGVSAAPPRSSSHTYDLSDALESSEGLAPLRAGLAAVRDDVARAREDSFIALVDGLGGEFDIDLPALDELGAGGQDLMRLMSLQSKRSDRLETAIGLVHEIARARTQLTRIDTVIAAIDETDHRRKLGQEVRTRLESDQLRKYPLDRRWSRGALDPDPMILRAAARKCELELPGDGWGEAPLDEVGRRVAALRARGEAARAVDLAERYIGLRRLIDAFDAETPWRYRHERLRTHARELDQLVRSRHDAERQRAAAEYRLWQAATRIDVNPSRWNTLPEMREALRRMVKQDLRWLVLVLGSDTPERLRELDSISAEALEMRSVSAALTPVSRQLADAHPRGSAVRERAEHCRYLITMVEAADEIADRTTHIDRFDANLDQWLDSALDIAGEADDLIVRSDHADIPRDGHAMSQSAPLTAALHRDRTGNERIVVPGRVGPGGFAFERYASLLHGDPQPIPVDADHSHRLLERALLTRVARLPVPQRDGFSVVVVDEVHAADADGVGAYTYRLEYHYDERRDDGWIELQDPGRGRYEPWDGSTVSEVPVRIWIMGFDQAGNAMRLPGAGTDAYPPDLQIGAGGSYSTETTVDLERADISTLQRALTDGVMTSVELVEAYQRRIQMLDKAGPRLNAIRVLNPEAIADAERLDAERRRGHIRGPLHGIPILIKDNIDVAGLPTTGGAVAFQDSYPSGDAFVVRRLREAGAIILGKTNLTELANFVADEMPSGHSGLGGTVLNAYGAGLDPGGSSTGSAVSVAAALAAAAIGTETAGSLVAPAAANSVVTIKPTGGVSRTGIMPTALSLDIAGPIARTVFDAAILLTVLTAADPQDPAAAPVADIDFTAELSVDALRNVRIGTIGAPYFFEGAQDVFREQGATLTPVEVHEADLPSAIANFEFARDMNQYLDRLPADAPIKTLADLIRFNDDHIIEGAIPYGQSRLIAANAIDLDDPAVLAKYHAHLDHATRDAQQRLERAFDASGADVLLFFQDTAHKVHARAKYPAVTIPIGYHPRTGQPLGATLVGKPHTDARLLAYAYAYEQAAQAWRPPSEINPALFSEILSGWIRRRTDSAPSLSPRPSAPDTESNRDGRPETPWSRRARTVEEQAVSPHAGNRSDTSETAEPGSETRQQTETAAVTPRRTESVPLPQESGTQAAISGADGTAHPHMPAVPDEPGGGSARPAESWPLVDLDWLRSEPATLSLVDRLDVDTRHVLDRYPGSAEKARRLDEALNPPWPGFREQVDIDAADLNRVIDDRLRVIARAVPEEHFEAIVNALHLTPTGRLEMVDALFEMRTGPGTSNAYRDSPQWRHDDTPSERIEYRLGLPTLMHLQAHHRDALSAITFVDRALHGPADSLAERIATDAYDELSRAVTDFAQSVPSEHYSAVVAALDVGAGAEAAILDSLHRTGAQADSDIQERLRTVANLVVGIVGADSHALAGVDVRDVRFAEEAAVALARFGPHNPYLVYRPDHVQLHRPGYPTLRGPLGGPLMAELAERRRAAPQLSFYGGRRDEGPIPGDPVIIHTLPTEDWGTLQLHVYQSPMLGEGAVVAAVVGTYEQLHARPPLVRAHSRCLYGDTLRSTRCDCYRQMISALDQMRAEGAGVLVYFDEGGGWSGGHEGRGVGLLNKATAYREEDKGLDTVQAFDHLHLPYDLRRYSHGAFMLRYIGVGEVRLMTNNPAKIAGLRKHGIRIADRVPQKFRGQDRDSYLETKMDKFGHLFDPNDFR